MIYPVAFNSNSGYKFLSKVPGGKYHTGRDLNWGAGNQDLGKPIASIEDGVIEYINLKAGGWGKLLIIFHPRQNIWVRHGHCNEILVKVGQIVNENQKIATVGKTGGNWSAHDHFDLIIKKLPTWTDYSKTNRTKVKVLEYYADPLVYIDNYNQTMANQNEEPIVKWHKKNKIIEDWSYPADKGMIREAWVAYKILKRVKEAGGNIGNIDLTLEK